VTLEGAVLAGFELGDAPRFDVEARRIEMFAELHRQRQADITETNDADAAFTQIEHDFLPVLCAELGRGMGVRHLRESVQALRQARGPVSRGTFRHSPSR